MAAVRARLRALSLFARCSAVRITLARRPSVPFTVIRRPALRSTLSRRAAAVLCAAPLLLAANAGPEGGLQRVSIDPAATRDVWSRLPAPRGGSPEARLLGVYRLIGEGRSREALTAAEALVRDVPTFQLAQLVYGDLLMSRRSPLPAFGGGVAELGGNTPEQLEHLRKEASLRLQALLEMPPEGAVPRQFVELPATTRHAIAVDASRARLYLFERTEAGMRLAASHYVSLGRLGIGKSVEGDQRTPLGIYYITSRLDDRQVADFYGPGALPLNYPNEHDRRLGRTGSGIWLHGVPSESYSRAPLATDGCVVMSNDDLRRLIATVSPRTTPVVIASRLEWVTAPQAELDRRAALALVESWREAVSSADLQRLESFYSPRFLGSNGSSSTWRKRLAQRTHAGVRPTLLKDVSVLASHDDGEVLVVTFGEIAKGERRGLTKRQYWGKEGGQWKIFYEGVI